MINILWKLHAWEKSSFQVIASVRYLLRKFYFSPTGSPAKTMKDVFLFNLLSSFRSRDIFVFPSSALFLPVTHCLRASSKINLKVYDVINCLNKNLITHFAWYLRRKKVMTLKLWPLRQYYIRNTFMEKPNRKCAPKASPILLFYFGKQPKTANPCKKFF